MRNLKNPVQLRIADTKFAAEDPAAKGKALGPHQPCHTTEAHGGGGELHSATSNATRSNMAVCLNSCTTCSADISVARQAQMMAMYKRQQEESKSIWSHHHLRLSSAMVSS